MADQDYYDILNVSKNASPEEIKKNYRKMSLKWHPDKYKGDDTSLALEKFSNIKEAYEVLSDPKKRKSYDEFGKDFEKYESFRGADFGGMGGMSMGGMGGGMGGMGGIFNLFRQGFGVPFGGAAAEEQIEMDIVKRMSISFPEAYVGVTKKFAYKKTINCETCNGIGALSKEYIDSCNGCNGRGFVMKQQQVNQFMISQSQSVCNQCSGKGVKIREGKECTSCNGKKHIQKETEINIPVPAGIEDGHKLVVRGYGNYVNNQKGNLIILVNIIEDDKYDMWERKGQNLYYNINITLGEALCGFQKSITHLNGQQLVIKSDNVIKPNQKKLISEEGMFYLNSKKKADLFLKFNIIFPSDEEVQSIKKNLQKILPFNSENLHIKSMKDTKLYEI